MKKILLITKLDAQTGNINSQRGMACPISGRNVVIALAIIKDSKEQQQNACKVHCYGIYFKSSFGPIFST